MTDEGIKRVEDLQKKIISMLHGLKYSMQALEDKIKVTEEFSKHLASYCNSQHEKIYDILSNMKTTFSPKKGEDMTL